MMKINVKDLAIVCLAIGLVSVLVYEFGYPYLRDYFLRQGTERTLDNIIAQIKLRGNPITIDTGNDVLVCDLVKRE